MLTTKQLVEQQGYAFLPSFFPDLDPTAAASVLGAPEQVEGLRLVHELLPTSMDVTTPNTYSGNFGLGAFPLHTDLAHWARPPRYLMLRFSRGDANTQTQIVDGSLVIETLGSSVLARCLARPRRPMKGALQLLPIWQASFEPNQEFIRWDSIYLKPANEFALAVFRRVDECLSCIQPVAKVLLNKGDTLLLDNWRVLHGRSQVQNLESPRKIHRLYLRCLT
jgi:alpha-ketoglutarate-dependent taurine dioxygenase